MWKRRVGVTARLRRIDGNSVMGFPQIASEMAAPPERRTPKGTAAQAAIRVRMEAWRQWRWSQLGEGSQKSVQRRTESGITGSPRWGIRPGDARICYSVARKRGARNARMRRCLKLRQGASPGASPLRPPPWPLTQAGLLMEAVTVRERFIVLATNRASRAASRRWSTAPAANT